MRDRCIDENEVATMLAGGLTEPEQTRIDGHLSGCPSCLALVAELGRVFAPDAPAEDSTRSPCEPGRWIGRFRIDRLVGQGAMGVVYLAEDTTLRRPVALKLLSRASSTPDAYARVLQEARLMAQLAAPHVVAVHDVGECELGPFIAMEFVAGQTLREWLGAERRSVHAVVDVMTQAGRGLAAAHAAGLVHRDFKPENVFVGADGRVRVGDFGLTIGARPAGQGPFRTEAFALEQPLPAGTPAYMAPEVLSGLPAVSASDQFSFSVVLFEALHGHRPFQGASLPELRWAASRGNRQACAPHLPSWLTQTITRGLKPDPEDRHANMDALVESIAVGRNARGLVHLHVNALLQLVMWGLHVAFTAFLVSIVLSGETATATASSPVDPTTGALEWYLVPLVLMFIVSAMAITVWAPLGVVWTLANAVGLYRQARWARMSTLIYSVLSLLTCFGTPAAIYGLLSLRTASVRRVFGEPR